MKKRKEEILRSKEQSTEQGKEQSTEQDKEQSTVQGKAQSTVQPNNTYVYVIGILAALAIGVCVFFAYNTFPKKQASDRSTDQHEQKQPPKRRHML